MSLSATALSELDAVFALWDRSDAPGLSVGISFEGRVVYRRGFGMASLENATANTSGTRHRIGSITKHMTGLLALLLAEEGLLDLDMQIRAYLPEMAGPGGEPTVRQLLQHRGGSRCHVDLSYIARGLSSPPIGAAFASQRRQQGRNFAPGEAMIYNNGGYTLASLAIERVGGASLEQLMADRLFAPLGMNDTLLVRSDYDITPGIATLHVRGLDGGWRRGLFPSEENLGDGGVVSTVDDMLLWAGHLRTRDRFGRPESWRALVEPPVFPDGETGNYALGLMRHDYRGLPILHHSGVVIGGSSQMLTFPEHGLDIVILANGGPAANPVKLAEQVADIVLDKTLEAGPPASKTADHEGLIGDWWSPDTGMIYSLADEGGDLKLRMCMFPYGFPLETREGGVLVSPGATIGEISLSVVDGETLSIRFGGAVAEYRRLCDDGLNAVDFDRAVIGRYRSLDGDCTAEIFYDEDRRFIRFQTRHGSVAARLDQRAPDVATTAPPGPGVFHWSAIHFEMADGQAKGFRLSTMRTRGLAFEPIQVS